MGNGCPERILRTSALNHYAMTLYYPACRLLCRRVIERYIDFREGRDRRRTVLISTADTPLTTVKTSDMTCSGQETFSRHPTRS